MANQDNSKPPPLLPATSASSAPSPIGSSITPTPTTPIAPSPICSTAMVTPQQYQGQLTQSPQNQILQSPQQVLQSPHSQVLQSPQGQVLQSTQNLLTSPQGQVLPQGTMMIQPGVLQQNTSLSSHVQMPQQLLQSGVQQTQLFNQTAHLLPQFQQFQQQGTAGTMMSLQQAQLQPGGATMSGNLQSTSNIRTTLPQVQVIQQPMNNFLQQYYSQNQQITNMLQNAAAVQALQARGITPGQLNLALLQQQQQQQQQHQQQQHQQQHQQQPGNNQQQQQQQQTAGGKQHQQQGHNMLGPACSTPQPQPIQPSPNQPSQPIGQNTNQKSVAGNMAKQTTVSMATTSTNQQQALLAGHKPMVRQQGPLVINQILPQGSSAQNATSQNKNLVAVSQAQHQMLNTANLRFSTPQLNTAQIISGQPTMITNPAVLNQIQAMALQQGLPVHSQVFSSQSPTILSGQQPLYIRTANPLQPGHVNISTPSITPVPREKSSDTPTPNQPRPQQGLPMKQTTGCQTMRPTVTGSSAGVPRMSSNGATQTAQKKLISKVKGKAQQTSTATGSNSPLPALTKTNAVTGTTQSEPTEHRAAPPATKIGTTKPPEPEVKNETGNEENRSPAVPNLPKCEKQRAIVKPHILTHVIDGFVIQEASEPFPVQRSSLLTEIVAPHRGQNKESGDERRVGTPDSFDANATLKCEFCGKVDIAKRFKRSKRFCSTACAKRYNVGCSRRLGRGKEGLGLSRKSGLTSPSKYSKNRRHALALRRVWRRQQRVRPFLAGRKDSESTRDPSERMSDTSSQSCRDDTSSPGTPTHHHGYDNEPVEVDMTKPPDKWNVEEVSHFISTIPGGDVYAEEFKTQEIDGQALMLLKEDHLMTAMNIKLGPALKLCAKINALKEEQTQQA